MNLQSRLYPISETGVGWAKVENCPGRRDFPGCLRHPSKWKPSSRPSLPSSPVRAGGVLRRCSAACCSPQLMRRSPPPCGCSVYRTTRTSKTITGFSTGHVGRPIKPPASCCGLLVKAFVPAGPVVIGLDDTVERRRGAKIAGRSMYRDAVRSSWGCFQKTSGLRWIGLHLIAPSALGQADMGTAVPDGPCPQRRTTHPMCGQAAATSP